MLVIIAALMAGGLAVSSALAGEYSFPYQKIIETGDTVELAVTCPVGSVEIRSQDAPQVIIDAVKKIKAAGKDEALEAADHMQISVEQIKRKIVVSADFLLAEHKDKSFLKNILGGRIETSGSVDLTIQVPVDCQVTIDNVSGKITVAETKGNVTIKSSAADINLSGVQGEINVDNNSGSMAGELLFGPVTVRQAMGKISLQWIEGDLRVKSTSADIDIKQERGSLDLVTASGNVRIQTNLDSRRDYSVETQSGNINLLIPEESSGMLAIASQTGDIKSEVPVTVKSMSKKQMIGELGSGGVKITLTSTSGDVSVAQF